VSAAPCEQVTQVPPGQVRTVRRRYRIPWDYPGEGRDDKLVYSSPKSERATIPSYGKYTNKDDA
jgi:hypothetical protein